MRSARFACLLVLLLNPVRGRAFAQDTPVAPQTSLPATGLTWKAALMAGDNEIEVFDNATKTLKSMFLRMGLEAANIRELSASRSEQQQRGALPSTADNLEAALRGLSVRKGDACLVHLTSHGTRQGFFLRNAASISPARLNAALESGCGDEPTVVLVSACYSGVFVDHVMQRPNLIILTAASSDRTSFGCSSENQYTYWDGCLIDSLTQSDNWNVLYRSVQRCVETKEARQRFMPSLPQAFFGDQIAGLRTPAAPPVTAVVAGNVDGSTSRCPVTTDVTYGFSAANPVKVGLDGATGPARELQYLNALRGPSGQPLRFRRVGTTVAAGNVILDIYELNHEGLASPVRIYLDAYHFEEPVAPRGFVCPIAIGLEP